MPFDDASLTVHVRHAQGLTPMHCAALESHRGMIERLVDKGANINVKGKVRSLPLPPLSSSAACLCAVRALFLPPHAPLPPQPHGLAPRPRVSLSTPYARPPDLRADHSSFIPLHLCPGPLLYIHHRNIYHPCASPHTHNSFLAARKHRLPPPTPRRLFTAGGLYALPHGSIAR